MRALLLGIMLLSACTPTPELASGEYQVAGGSGAVGGARIRVDAQERQIVMLGGCSGHYLDYRLDGARLNVVDEAVTAEACFDGGPYADDVNNRVSELLNQRPRVILTDGGFDLVPASGGPSISFVQTSKNAQN